MRVWGLALLSGLAAAPAAADGSQTYRGLCEASAAVYLDATHFAVASDETNILRIYRRGDTTAGLPVDLTGSSHDKSDLEAAARIGDRVYWLSSHSLNSQGEDKAKRKLLLVTEITREATGPGLRQVALVRGLREPLLEAIGGGIAPADLNIEGLAATDSGALLIGLRNTQVGRAIVIALTNPAAVADAGAAPEFGVPEPLDLGGLGVRSLERVGDAYLIVAGKVSDGSGFGLYDWAGPGSVPVARKGPAFADLRPEALMAVPGTDLLQVLSDDCDDETTVRADRAFRSLDLAR